MYIKVNNKKIDIYKVNNGFIGIKINKGKNNILGESNVQFSSVQFSRSVVSNSLRPH